MKTIKGSFQLDDLAHALATLAADILECEVSEIDLSMEAPAPLEPGEVKLAWSSAGSPESTAPVEASTAPTKTAAPSKAPASRNGDGRTRARDHEEDEVRPEDLDAEGEAAADFLEGLLDAMDIEGDMKIEIGEGVIEVEIVESDSGSLIGRRGQTLESIQEMLRSSMQRQFQRRSRVVVDVEGYRRRRLEKFLEDAERAINDVLDGSDSVRLEPMDVYERKQVHQLVATHDGLVSRSHGREPSRRVVIERA